MTSPTPRPDDTRAESARPVPMSTPRPGGSNHGACDDRQRWVDLCNEIGSQRDTARAELADATVDLEMFRSILRAYRAALDAVEALCEKNSSIDGYLEMGEVSILDLRAALAPDTEAGQ